MDPWSHIAEAIAAAEAHPFRIESRRGVGGGCINETFRIDGDDGRRYFVKLHEARMQEMFAAEAEGLHAILAARSANQTKG